MDEARRAKATATPRLETPTSRVSAFEVPDYKPTSLKWPFITFLLIYIGALVGTIEYGYRILPVVNEQKGVVPERTPDEATAGALLSVPLEEAKKSSVVTFPLLPPNNTWRSAPTPPLQPSLPARAASREPPRSRNATPTGGITTDTSSNMAPATTSVKPLSHSSSSGTLIAPGTTGSSPNPPTSTKDQSLKLQDIRSQISNVSTMLQDLSNRLSSAAPNTVEYHSQSEEQGALTAQVLYAAGEIVQGVVSTMQAHAVGPAKDSVRFSDDNTTYIEYVLIPVINSCKSVLWDVRASSAVAGVGLPQNIYLNLSALWYNIHLLETALIIHIAQGNLFASDGFWPVLNATAWTDTGDPGPFFNSGLTGASLSPGLMQNVDSASGPWHPSRARYGTIDGPIVRIDQGSSTCATQNFILGPDDTILDYLYGYIHYYPDDADHAKWCGVRCDGAVLVFFEMRCYTEWLDDANRLYRLIEQDAQLSQQGHKHRLYWGYEESEMGGKKCGSAADSETDSAPPPSPSSPTDTVVVLASTQYVEITTVSGIKSTFTGTSIITATLTVLHGAAITAPPPARPASAAPLAAGTRSPLPNSGVDSLGQAMAVPSRSPAPSADLGVLTSPSTAKAADTISPPVFGVESATNDLVRGPGGSDGPTRASTPMITLTPLAKTPAPHTLITTTNSLGQVVTTSVAYDAFNSPGAANYSASGDLGPFSGHATGDAGQSAHPPSPAEYAFVTVFPILLVLPLSIAIQIIHANIQALLPFHMLACGADSSIADTLCMDTGGFSGVLHGVRRLRTMKAPLPLISTLMALLAAVLTPLSTEAVGIKLNGHCEVDDSRGCYFTMAIFNSPARAAQALLVLTGILSFSLLCFLSRWRSGVVGPPWSIARVASLLQDQKTRKLLRDLRASNHTKTLPGYSCSLRQSCESPGDYGILIRLASTEPNSHAEAIVPSRRRPSRFGTISALSRRDVIPKLFLLVLCSLLILVVYYGSVELDRSDTFERFIDTPTFGRRAIFALLGLLISLYWDMYYTRLSVLEPFYRLARKPQLAEDSVLISRPTSCYTGLYESLARQDFVSSAIAFAVVLAKFTPAVLSNIPFSPAQTWTAHSIYTWTTVALLSYMIVAFVIASLILRPPRMAVDPTDLRGMSHYLCDSPIIDDFEGLSLLPDRKFQGEVRKMKTRYVYKRVVDDSGEEKPAINYSTITTI